MYPECLAFKDREKILLNYPKTGAQSSRNRECYSWVLKWLENFLWTRWDRRLMPCTEECFLPSHITLEQGGHRFLGHQLPQLLVLRPAVEWVGGQQLFPQGRERGGLRGGNSCEEHTAGTNHAGKVPKRVGVSLWCPCTGCHSTAQTNTRRVHKAPLKTYQFPI